MSLSRRNFLKLSLGAGLSLSLSTFSSSASFNDLQNKKTLLYSAAMDQQGNYLAVALSDRGKLIFKTPLPARAHALLMHPDKSKVLVFSRRPGYFLLVLNAQTGQIIQRIKTHENRPLCGHGVFSKDGNTLYLSANDIDQGHGVIQVLDVNNGYKKVNEFSSGGIGPHEVGLLRDDKTLVVANGGILTHPDSGRSKLNLDSMTPALTYLNTQTGNVIADYRLAKKYHQLSIRHFDINQDDTVCFAMQYQGARQHRFPLVGFHHQGQSMLKLADVPIALLSKMKNYCGSVCADQSGKHFAVSSPRGDLMTLWNERGDYLSSQTLKDGCGIATAYDESSFYLSSGTGRIHHYHNTGQQNTLINHFKDYRWDNHLLSAKMKSE